MLYNMEGKKGNYKKIMFLLVCKCSGITTLEEAAMPSDVGQVGEFPISCTPAYWPFHSTARVTSSDVVFCNGESCSEPEKQNINLPLICLHRKFSGN